MTQQGALGAAPWGLRRAFPAQIALAVAGLSAACGAAPRPTIPPHGPPLRIVALPSGSELSPEALTLALLEAQAIFVGERHDSEPDHRAQAWLVRALAARDPSLAVGVEMVQRPYQEALDLWSAGAIDDDALLARTEWSERWRLDFELYRPIFVAAREAGARLVALNAPRELTRAIARGGLESLDEATRATLPDLDLGVAAHREMVMAALAGHGADGHHGDGGGMDPAMLERFYLAQVVWDETMGEGVSRVLGAGDAPHRIVALAGRMHVQAGLGVPRCAARRVPGLRSVVVLPLTDEEARAEVGAETPAADYALVVE